MKKKLLFIVIALVLTGCSKPSAPIDGEGYHRETYQEETEQEETNRKETAQEEATATPQAEAMSGEANSDNQLLSSENRAFAANGREIELTAEEWTRVLAAWENLQEAEPALPKEGGAGGDVFTIFIGDEAHSICLTSDKYNAYVLVDQRAEYLCTEEINELFERYCTDDVTEEVYVFDSNPKEQLIGLSVECDEPKNQEEYLETARAVVKPWLDSLKSVEGEYSLPSYTFTDKLADNREFHGDGYINGGREFVCYVAFDTPTEDEDSVFYASGTYDTFYHYYFGPGILARFRWEDGVCTLTEYDEAFAMLTSDKLKDGLYGIDENESEYKTFYDFLNDEENVKSWLGKDLQSKLCRYRVSHNVMMLSNGNVIFMDIGNNAKPEYDGDLVTTDMSQYYYDAKMDDIYSSPVDFIDGQGAVVMTYHDGFSMVYDDYNHDGNPDYAIRINSDEHGSTYDVRCMDINGTPWEDETEVYIYGAFEESIRLQVYDGSSILKPVDNGDGGISFERGFLFKDKSNTTHHEVTDEPLQEYRMYSQKFYLPESLRGYSEQDEEVICYFWNNTEKAVTLQEEYEIQRKNGDIWESVGTGTIDSITVNGYGYEEISFDISGIGSQEMALYRIKTYVGEEAVYGGFYYGTEGKTTLDITSEVHPDWIKSLSFTVTNTGMFAAYPDSAVLYYNGEKLCDVDLNDISRINGGKAQTVTVTEEDIRGKFGIGEYTLEIMTNGTKFSGTSQVVSVPAENRYYFPQEVNATKKVNAISIPLTNNIWTKENAVIVRIEEVEVLKDGVWFSTLYTSDMLDGYSEDLVIPFGETIEIGLNENSEIMDELQYFFRELQSGDYAELMEENEELMSMTFEEFAEDVLNIMSAETGDLCRVCICFTNSGSDSEYVYFEMP